MLLYSSVEQRLTQYGRVVELVDSLDSGSSVHCGRAGSSPASPTRKTCFGMSFFFYMRKLTSSPLFIFNTSKYNPNYFQYFSVFQEKPIDKFLLRCYYIQVLSKSANKWASGGIGRLARFRF